MRRVLKIAAAGLMVAAGVLPARAAETPDARLAERLAAAVQALRPVRPADAPGRLPDLELFALAEAYASLGQTDRADAYRRYLKNFFRTSPLLALLPPATDEAEFLENYDPDPDFSRLIRNIYRRLVLAEQPLPPRAAQEEAELLLAVAAADPGFLPAPEDLQAFLRRHPESPWAGWAAYQLLWASRLEPDDGSSTAGFSRFAAEHREHPLGEEAGEALDVRRVSPRQMALISAALPGLSGEWLEPGTHESGSALYTEAMLVTGAVAFTIAAQTSSRPANLAGALLMINLLMLNHSSGAGRAYEDGYRYNLGGRRHFIAERMDRPVAGTGCFAEGDYYTPPPVEPLANDGVLSVAYRQWGAGEALRGRGWVQDEQLANLGLRLEYLRSLWDAARTRDFALSAGAAPYVRWFGTHAAPTAGSPLTQGANVQEAGAGVEAALLARLGLGGSWGQVRLSAGPGFRWRALDASGSGYSDAGPVATATAAVGLGAPGGVYWQIGVTADHSFAPGTFTLENVALDVPALGWDVQSSLGVHF